MEKLLNRIDFCFCFLFGKKGALIDVISKTGEIKLKGNKIQRKWELNLKTTRKCIVILSQKRKYLVFFFVYICI